MLSIKCNNTLKKLKKMTKFDGHKILIILLLDEEREIHCLA